MTGAAWLSIALFFALALALMLGLPVAFTLAGVSLLFAGIGIATGTFDPVFLDAFPNRVYGIMGNETLLAVPLFVFMGYLVERANLIEKLFKSLHLAMARIPGSLAVATLVTCAIFATATGIVGAVQAAEALKLLAGCGETPHRSPAPPGCPGDGLADGAPGARPVPVRRFRQSSGGARLHRTLAQL